MVISRNIAKFAGLPVCRFHDNWVEEAGRCAWRFAKDYRGPALIEVLETMVSDPNASAVRALVFGVWDNEMFGNPPTELCNYLVASASKLPALEGIFISEVTYEKCEISWLTLCDVGPVVNAFGGLRTFAVRGGNRLRLKDLRHDKLESLLIEAGGLDASTVRDVTDAHLPALTSLSLWLGTEDYGGTSSVADLMPILSGKVFPGLKQLGLKNCDYEDAIAEAIASAPVLAQLDELDLSMGILTDAGAEHLLSSPGIKKLKKLDVSKNYLSEEMDARLVDWVDGEVITGTDKEEEDDEEDPWRYVSVGE